MTRTDPASSIGIVDSRRLLGPNLYSVCGGVVLEVSCDDSRIDVLTRAWSRGASAMARELGWGEVETHVRREPGGATVFMTAPVDALMTATDVNEAAWTAAHSGVDACEPSPTRSRLLASAAAERDAQPNVAAVFTEALARNVSATFDDDLLTIGSGAGSQSWALSDVPDAREIAWDTVRDIPIALVTGSNGKTTTTRLIAAMWRAAGVTPGWSCSDGVWVGDRQLEWGDFSGPAGARAVLRDPAVGAAVLETARGGILRRGLAVTRADAAIITNVSADHFGEYGIANLTDLADVKAVVASVLGAEGRLVLNADDALLVALGARYPAQVSWFSASPTHLGLDAHVRSGGDAACVRDGCAMLHRDGVWCELGEVVAMPITLGGAALHNIENILGAALLAASIGIPLAAIRATLGNFGAVASDNPGRLQVYRFGGLTVLVDYAHNPDGLAALCGAASAISASRRLLLLGQAGNRDDEQLRALAHAACEVIRFDRVIVKEETELLRGRLAGDVPRILAEALVHAGLPAQHLEIASSEMAAVRRAFEWARNGDLLVCPIHVDKAAVLAWMSKLNDADWTPGAALP